MKKVLILLLVLMLPLPAIAAKGQASKKHPETKAEQECTACHDKATQVWESGKHGLMGVKCVVCHGSPERNFTPKPGAVRCRGCHGDKVAEIEKRLPKQDCSICHDHHNETLRFHQSEGGK